MAKIEPTKEQAEAAAKRVRDAAQNYNEAVVSARDMGIVVTSSLTKNAIIVDNITVTAEL